ncbi:MAG: hypothetical protein A2Z11_01810 [Candidatus Woykebacteria bacterium RBG_16_43_9]|uniref:SGNH hydrolase-type esterase domain-containing protein n=1 Tax=Candidatus Woykebacteria bacterium RBG_16_43_9 TaxID=1802596 RepID=A0A1G1WBX9_9BACT|nr:MAG: hypothetical protein A2Z11_01810 [Candidatus Woykebacteria bacterium RBG_16_43_9]
MFFFFSGGPTGEVTKEGPIIFFGNSLTAGVGAGNGEDFPSLVANELNLSNVIHAGMPGATTKTALNRIRPDVVDKNPSIVIVELSGNDFLRGIPLDDTVNNLESITAQIRKTGAAVVLIHIRFPQKADKYEDGFKKIAKKHQALVVWNSLDGVIGNSALMADNIHPNAAGYKIMARRVVKVLRPLIK